MGSQGLSEKLVLEKGRSTRINTSATTIRPPRGRKGVGVLVYNRTRDGMRHDDARRFYAEAIKSNTDFVDVVVTQKQITVFASSKRAGNMEEIREQIMLMSNSFLRSVDEASSAASKRHNTQRQSGNNQAGWRVQRQYRSSNRGQSVTRRHSGS